MGSVIYLLATKQTFAGYTTHELMKPLTIEEWWWGWLQSIGREECRNVRLQESICSSNAWTYPMGLVRLLQKSRTDFRDLRSTSLMV